MTTTVLTSAPDYPAIKTRQNAAWASGDYSRIGVTLQIVGESLAEAMDLRPGASVLDVAAGHGAFGIVRPLRSGWLRTSL